MNKFVGDVELFGWEVGASFVGHGDGTFDAPAETEVFCKVDLGGWRRGGLGRKELDILLIANDH